MKNWSSVGLAVTMDDYEYDSLENDSFNYSYTDYPMLCEKEDVRSFASVFLPIIYALALVVGLAGNSLVVAVYVHFKKLKTLTDMFILNLAVADILLLFTLPFWAAGAVVGWELGVAMCKLTASLYVMNFSCGMLFLACISVDRYLAVFHSELSRAFQRRHCVAVCLAVWALAFALGIPDMVFSTVRHTSSHKSCMPVFPSNMGQATKASLEIVEVLLSFLLPFSVMLFCYIRVGLALIRTPKASHGKKWKAFKVLLAVMGAFIITQLPYNAVKFCRAMDMIYLLVVHCEMSKKLDRATQVTESLALVHSCLNPILYAFIGASFSQHILKLMKGFGQRRRRQRQEHNGEPPVEISLNSHSSSNATSTFTI